MDRFPEIKENPAALVEILVADYRINRANGMRLDDVVCRYPQVEDEFRSAADLLEPIPWTPLPLPLRTHRLTISAAHRTLTLVLTVPA